MSLSFGISAPGKVILFGEHAVVYGYTAVAASLDLRTRLQFSEISDEDWIYVDLPKIDLSCKIPFRPLLHHLSNNDCPKLGQSEPDGHEALLNHIRKFSVSLTEIEGAQHQTSVECFLFSLAQAIQSENLNLRPFRIFLDTSLSVASGSGSSASFAVCLAACFLYWSRLQKNPDSESSFDRSSLELVSKNAFECEKIIHGKPSGIDNSICTFGSFVEFRSGKLLDRDDPFKIENIKILLVDTKVGRSTKAQVQKLADLRKEYPEIVNPMLESMNEVSRKAIKFLREMESDGDNRQIEFFDKLMVLIKINQGLLGTCQLSHPSLDSICRISENFGLGAKLTGAGGGGYAYVLLPPNSLDTENLIAEFTNNGFAVTKTTLGGRGVEIHKHLHQD